MYRRTFRPHNVYQPESCTIASKVVPVSSLDTYLDAGIAPQASPLLHATKDEFDSALLSSIDDISELAIHNADNVPVAESLETPAESADILNPNNN